ncbi:MAG: OmpA family protein [Chitinophagales bacterium]|nr:OmpA family protein [Chitinophagales bacterium]
MQIKRIALFLTFLIFCTLSIDTIAQEDAQPKEEVVKEEVKEPEVKEPKEPKKPKEPKPIKRVVDPSVPKPYKSWSISLVPGITTGFTDVKGKDFFGVGKPKNENQFGISANVTKMLSGAFGIMGRAYYGKIVGVLDENTLSIEDTRYYVDLGIVQSVYFEQTALQGSINLYWNISNTIFNMNKQYKSDRFGTVKKKRWISVYTYGGVGLAQYDEPKLLIEATDVPISSTYLTSTPSPGSNSYIINGNEKFSELILPLALGVKFKVSRAIDIGIEGVQTFAMTDKIDGLVYDHPNKPKNDKYTHVGVSFTYKVGGKKLNKEHMEWINPTEEIAESISSIDRKLDKIAKDSDKDGVSDAFDKDLNTPEGVRVDGSGMAMDVDMDGVPDYEDLEPFTDKDAVVDEFGEALDSDQDGVPDHRDREPNTVKDAFVNFQGMTIIDALDIDVSDKYRTMILPSIYFDYNRTTIKSEYETRLFEIARLLKENEGLKLLVIGNTDETGSESYNEDLAKRRAERVINYLVEQYGIPAASLVAVSKGESNPQSRKNKLNRRVDFIPTE